MCVIGEKKKVTRLELDGSKTVHEEVEIGLTLDERIADGFYFARSLKVVEYLFAHPEIMEEPFANPTGYVYE